MGGARALPWRHEARTPAASRAPPCPPRPGPRARTHRGAQPWPPAGRRALLGRRRDHVGDLRPHLPGDLRGLGHHRRHRLRHARPPRLVAGHGAGGVERVRRAGMACVVCCCAELHPRPHGSRGPLAAPRREEGAPRREGMGGPRGRGVIGVVGGCVGAPAPVRARPRSRPLGALAGLACGPGRYGHRRVNCHRYKQPPRAVWCLSAAPIAHRGRAREGALIRLPSQRWGETPPRSLAGRHRRPRRDTRAHHAAETRGPRCGPAAGE